MTVCVDAASNMPVERPAGSLAFARRRRSLPALSRQAEAMDVVAEICDLPVRFKTRGDVSVAALVDESGYRQTPSALTVEAVSAHLVQRPDLVDAWFGYSEDKRTSSGWYVTERSPEKFEVGYYPKGERLAVTGRIRACAEFIVREVGSIAG